MDKLSKLAVIYLLKSNLYVSWLQTRLLSSSAQWRANPSVSSAEPTHLVCQVAGGEVNSYFQA